MGLVEDFLMCQKVNSWMGLDVDFWKGLDYDFRAFQQADWRMGLRWVLRMDLDEDFR